MALLKNAKAIKVGDRQVLRLMLRGEPIWPLGTAPDPDQGPLPIPTGLPELGFSVNGPTLSGPIQQSHYNELAAIGSRWIRTGFAPGSYATLADQFFAAARASGQNVLLRASLPDRQYAGLDPVNVAAYGDHMAALALRYKGAGPGGANPVMELPNELNGRVSGSVYAQMAANAYPKVKAIDPTYQVIGGSENVYASGWATWLEDLYKGGFANFADGVSFHNYDGPGDQTKWVTLRNLMNQYGHGDAYVWLSEFGGTTCSNTPSDSINDNGCLTELGQANKIVAVLNDIKANKPYVTHAIVYTDEDVPSRQSTDPFEANFGLYKNDVDGNIVRPKAAVAALRSLYAQSTGPVVPPYQNGGAFEVASVPLKAATFPLVVSGKGFLDAAGKPFVGMADTAWNAISRMTRAEFTSYITQRRAQGYTAIFMSILDINSRTRTQATSGTTPFTASGNSTNFTSRNLSGTISYWDQVAWCVDQLAAKGMLAVLVPCWFGFHGATWRGHIATSSTDTATATSYGTFLASLLGGKANVMWLHGGDSAPTTGTQSDSIPSGLPNVDVTAAVNTLANTIRSNATVSQLHTYHTSRNDTAFTYFGGQSWYNLNAAYSGLDSATRVVTEWQRTNNKPTVTVEMYYSARNEVGAASPYPSRKELRQQTWQSMCSGALLTANGSEYIWQVRDYYAGQEWTEGMNLQSVSDLTVLSRVFASFPSKSFQADHSSPLITSNRGSGLTLAPALVSSDAKAAIAYIPDVRTVTLSTSKVFGALWHWVHPETAQVIKAGSTYTVPSGWADAILVGYVPTGTG